MPGPTSPVTREDLVVASVDACAWPHLTVTPIGASRRYPAVASRLLQQLWIQPHPGDVVTVDLASDPPTVEYLWWRVALTGRTRDGFSIEPVPSAGQQQARPGPNMMPAVGESAFVIPGPALGNELEIVDIAVDGRPRDPGRLLERHRRLWREELTEENACFYMAAEDLAIDEELVRGLLWVQHPDLADLRIERVPAWDNAVFRLGNDLSVRLPRGRWAIPQVAMEHQWLPRLAPHLPLPIPVPLRLGEPSVDYPWQWSVYPWFEGTRATANAIDDPRQAALDLAEFIASLQRIDTTGGPPSGPANCYAACPLQGRDAAVRASIGTVDDPAIREFLTARWERVLASPPWEGRPTWVHGDLAPGNILARDGRISAVIDFGVLAVGDPAGDVRAAWTMLPAAARPVFRDALDVDDQLWERARWWAVSSRLPSLIEEIVRELDDG